MKHNKDIDAICWCEMCESYRGDYYIVKEHRRWIITGVLIALFVAAFINAGMTETFYLTHTL